MTRTLWAALLLGIVLAVGVNIRSGDGGSDAITERMRKPRAERTFSGYVLAGGQAAAGARVVLFEAKDGGFVSQPAETDALGAFEIRWKPTATENPKHLRIAAEMEGYARTIVRLERSGTTVPLATPGTFSGRTAKGARVLVALKDDYQPATSVTAGDDGRFELAGLAQGAEVDVLVVGGQVFPEVEPRFRVGDFAILRTEPGLPIRVRVTDLDGGAIPGAKVSLPLPRALSIPAVSTDDSGVARLPDASDNGPRQLRVEAPDRQPILVWAMPHVENEVTLWPSRTVRLEVLDSRLKGAIELRPIRARHVELVTPGETHDWWGAHPERIAPVFGFRPDPDSSAYLLELPRCPVKLVVRAAGYSDAELTVKPDAGRVRAFLGERGRWPRAEIVLRAATGGVLPEGVPFIVLHSESGFLKTVLVGQKEARVEVPAGAKLNVASVSAAEGFWAPLQTIQAPARGRSEAFTIGLRPAVRLTLRVLGENNEPVNEGEAEIKDLDHEDFDPGTTVPIREGVAAFWIRPNRIIRVRIDGPPSYYERLVDLEPVDEDTTRRVRLRAASGLKVQVRDASGDPVPFAGLRLWAPNEAGETNLWADPLVEMADAKGAAFFRRLHPGEAALEAVAPGYRARRFGIVELSAGEVSDFPPIRLVDAPFVSGTVVDSKGEPVAGAWIRIIGPRVPRLPGPGGSFELYDPELHRGPVCSTNGSGGFSVRNEAAGPPLLSLDPEGRSDLVPSFAELPEGGRPIVLRGRAHLEYHDRRRIFGIYALLPGRRVVLLGKDPPMRLRPLSILISAGATRVHIRRRDGHTSTGDVNVEPGDTVVLQDLRWLPPPWKR